MNSQNEWAGRYFLMRKGYEELPGPDDVDLLAGTVYFNHWSRRLSPFRSLAEGDTLYLLDHDRRTLAVEMRVASRIASPYETLQEGLDQLRAVYGMFENEDDGGWPGYNPAPGPGYLLAFDVDVISAIDIRFEFPWDILGGHNGFISVETFAESDRIDANRRDAVLDQLPSPGRQVLAAAPPTDLRAVINDELLVRAPRRPSLAVKKIVTARSKRTCESEGCLRLAAHFDHRVPWSKGGNSELANIAHLCGPCNLAKSDQMPDSYWPDQMWITYLAHDLDGDSATLSGNATAAEVRTANSVYLVVADDETMLVWKRGQRNVFCAQVSDESGLHRLGGDEAFLVIGVHPNGERAEGACFLQTSPVESSRSIPVEEALGRLGISAPVKLRFSN